MKRIISLIMVVAVILSVFAFAACGKPKTVNKSAQEICSAVIEKSGFGAMTPVASRDYMDIYGIDTSKLAESAWFMSENPAVNADEIGVFKVSEAAYAETLSKIISDRIARQLQVAETYSPEEAGKLKSAQVVTQGDWVFYCVGDNASDMLNAFWAQIG